MTSEGIKYLSLRLIMEFISLVGLTFCIHLSEGLAIPAQDDPKISGKVFFYGAEQKNLDNSICAVGEILNEDGTCNPSGEASRSWSFYAANTKQVEPKTTHRPKMKYDIVVIHPQENKQIDPIIVPPPSEKNVVVVLRKEPKVKSPRIIEVSTYPPLSPEVHFVDYREGTNMLLPGGIDLKSALAQAQIKANRIKSEPSERIPNGYQLNNQRRNYVETKKTHPSEDLKMKENFERFIRSKMENNKDKSFKDLVYDYIVETNLTDDNETDYGEADVVDETTEEVTHLGENKLKNIVETNIDENSVIFKETTTMMPVNNVGNNKTEWNFSNKSHTKSPLTTKMFLGETFTREVPDAWRGITRSYQHEPSVFSTKNSVSMLSSVGNIATIPQLQLNIQKIVAPKEFQIPNQTPSIKINKADNKQNKNYEIESELKSDVGSETFYGTQTNDIQLEKSEKIIPEIETFFKELLQEVNPELDIKKFDFIIKGMSKIVAESNLFKSQVKKLKKVTTDIISGPSLEENNHIEKNSYNSSEIIKMDDAFEKNRTNNSIRQFLKIPEISNEVNKPEESSQIITKTDARLSNILESGQVKKDAQKTTINDPLKFSLNPVVRPNKQHIDNSYKRYMSSYMNSFSNLRTTDLNSNKDSDAKVKEFVGKVGSISKTFKDGWRGMEFTNSNPRIAEASRNFPNSGHNLTNQKNKKSENMTKIAIEKSDPRVKEIEMNNLNDNKSFLNSLTVSTHEHSSNNSHDRLTNTDIENPANLQLIEEGRSYFTSKYDISHDDMRKIINGFINQPTKLGTKIDLAEDIFHIAPPKNESTYLSNNQSEIELRVKPSYLDKHLDKQEIRTTIGDIIYGKQMANDVHDMETQTQISGNKNKNDSKIKSYENKSSNQTQMLPTTKIPDEQTKNGVKYIIEKIMSGKPFDKGSTPNTTSKQRQATEIYDNSRNYLHQPKIVSEVTTVSTIGDKYLEKGVKISTEANQPLQPPHKMVTTSVGIDITDPRFLKRGRYGATEAIIIRPQLDKISKTVTSHNNDNNFDNPLTIATKSNTNNNQFRNDPLPQNRNKEDEISFKTNTNNSIFNKEFKSEKTATKFTINDMKPNPYSHKIQVNHSFEIGWKPLNELRNDTESIIISSLSGLLSNGPGGEPSANIGLSRDDKELPNRPGEKLELATVTKDKPSSISEGNSNHYIAKNRKEYSGKTEGPQKTFDGSKDANKEQLSQLKEERKPFLVANDDKESSNTKWTHIDPLKGRPWLNVAISL